MKKNILMGLLIVYIVITELPLMYIRGLSETIKTVIVGLGKHWNTMTDYLIQKIVK